jgi:hypothetical protein
MDNGRLGLTKDWMAFADQWIQLVAFDRMQDRKKEEVD